MICGKEAMGVAAEAKGSQGRCVTCNVTRGCHGEGKGNHQVRAIERIETRQTQESRIVLATILRLKSRANVGRSRKKAVL